MAHRLVIALAMLALRSDAYSLPASRLAQHRRGTGCLTAAGTVWESCVTVPASIGASLPPGRSGAVVMGLFGLGWAEIGIIGVIALFVFGPDRLVPFARDLGKQSVGLKVRTAARHSLSPSRAVPLP